MTSAVSGHCSFNTQQLYKLSSMKQTTVDPDKSNWMPFSFIHLDIRHELTLQWPQPGSRAQPTCAVSATIRGH